MLVIGRVQADFIENSLPNERLLLPVDVSMVTYERINGGLLAELVRDSALGQEGFARAIGMKRSGLQRIAKAGTYDMQQENFKNLADFLHLSVDALRKKIGANGDKSDKYKLIRVPIEVYAGLKLKAGARTIEQFLADLVKATPALNLDVIEAVPESAAAPEATAARDLHKPPARRKGRRSSHQEAP